MKKIIDKLLTLKKEVIMYIIFGVLTTLVYFITYGICTRLLSIGVMTSSVIAWVIAVIFAFITNKLWVFESKNLAKMKVIKEAFSFFMARLFSLLVDLLITYVGVTMLSIYDFYVKIFSQVVIIILNYILSKFIVFKKGEKDA